MNDKSPGQVRFLVDRMLGRLAAYLVMLGYDARFISERQRLKIGETARREGRTIVSRDTRLARRKNLPPFVLIQDDQPLNQLKQVVRECRLQPEPSQTGQSMSTSADGSVNGK